MIYLNGFVRLKKHRDKKLKEEARNKDNIRAFKERYKLKFAQQYKEEEKVAMKKVEELKYNKKEELNIQFN